MTFAMQFFVLFLLVNYIQLTMFTFLCVRNVYGYQYNKKIKKLALSIQDIVILKKNKTDYFLTLYSWYLI